MTDNNYIIEQVADTFSLNALSRPVELNPLAMQWGVSAIEQQAIASEAMLVPGVNGYKIILKSATGAGELIRQRFSFAHELGHLLLQKVGYKPSSNLRSKHRSLHSNTEEERLCDQIAAEILMPRLVFAQDGDRMGWALGSLSSLARLYGTSIPATARRMVGLMEETCVMGIWKLGNSDDWSVSLQQSYGRSSKYGVRNAIGLPRRRLWLVHRASNSSDIESGIAPVVHRQRPQAHPTDVPAEAWAWGRNDQRRVMTYYYPERRLTDQMVSLAKATSLA